MSTPYASLKNRVIMYCTSCGPAVEIGPGMKDVPPGVYVELTDDVMRYFRVKIERGLGSARVSRAKLSSAIDFYHRCMDALGWPFLSSQSPKISELPVPPKVAGFDFDLPYVHGKPAELREGWSAGFRMAYDFDQEE